jgi:hypothetical protein
MMKLVVMNGDLEGRVGLYHWWPRRDYWVNNSPIPFHIRNRARCNGNKYLTMAFVDFPNSRLATYTSCHPTKDQPTREAGRFIALLRLGRLLKSMGLKWERVE